MVGGINALDDMLLVTWALSSQLLVDPTLSEKPKFHIGVSRDPLGPKTVMARRVLITMGDPVIRLVLH